MNEAVESHLVVDDVDYRTFRSVAVGFGHVGDIHQAVAHNIAREVLFVRAQTVGVQRQKRYGQGRGLGALGVL